MKQQNIRNFCIIAHIDHGKSTLADRILEITNAVSLRDMKEQVLDNMDLERERGITIKLKAIKLDYTYNNEEYILNLIDTPGHVDFSYEVSRSLEACEGAILVVDAAQGIEAQTLANLYLALNSNLTIIPVINKIDLPNANIDKVKKELVDLLGFNEEEILLCSGKTGEGVKSLVENIIHRIKPPVINNQSPLRALIFDSYFDPYNGVVGMIKIVDGTIKVHDQIKMMATGATYELLDLGFHTPKIVKSNELQCGEVGYFSASIKEIGSVKVGDTITLLNNPAILETQLKIVPTLFEGDQPFLFYTPSFEEHLAEKLCIIVETNKPDVLNTRLKDFYDVYQLHGGKYDPEKLSRYFAIMLEKRGKIKLEDATTEHLDSRFIIQHQETWKNNRRIYEFLDYQTNLTQVVFYSKAVLSEQLQKLRIVKEKQIRKGKTYHLAKIHDVKR